MNTTSILPKPTCCLAATYNSQPHSSSYSNIRYPNNYSKINKLPLWNKSCCFPLEHPLLRPSPATGEDLSSSTTTSNDEEEESAAAAAREAISEILQDFGASKEDSIYIALRSPKYLAMLLDTVRELDDLSLWDSSTTRRRKQSSSSQSSSSPLSLKEKVYYMALEKADKGKIPFLESLDLGLPSATHLARRLSSQTLPNLITKVLLYYQYKITPKLRLQIFMLLPCILLHCISCLVTTWYYALCYYPKIEEKTKASTEYQLQKNSKTV